MAETSYIGAYWGPREEALEMCAEHTVNLLDGLRKIHPLFNTWFMPGRGRRAALEQRVDPSVSVLREMMLDRSTRRGHEDLDPPGSGFAVDLWNGQEPEVGFSITCGASLDSPRMSSNALVLNLPVPEGKALELYRRATAVACVRLIVMTVDPSWATFSNDTLLTAQLPRKGRVVAGWATYVADPDRAIVGNLPSGVTVEQLGRGFLILAGGDASNMDPSDAVAVRDAVSMEQED